MRVEGQLKVGEAAPVAAQVRRRLCGPQWVVLGLLVVIIFGSGVIGAAIDDHLIGSGLGSLVGLPFGWFLGYRVYFQISQSQGKKRLAGRGVVGPLALAVELTPDALVQSIGGVTKRASWADISELFRAGGYWVFVVQGEAWYLPRRYFEVPERERAFVAEALERMDDAGRGRSREAAVFLAKAA